jgi:hypothetical protein
VPTSLKERFARKDARFKPKRATRSLEAALGQALDATRECSHCSAPFDPRSAEMLDTWRVTADEEGVILSCPQCQGGVEEGETTDVSTP